MAITDYKGLKLSIRRMLYSNSVELAKKLQRVSTRRQAVARVQEVLLWRVTFKSMSSPSTLIAALTAKKLFLSN